MMGVLIGLTSFLFLALGAVGFLFMKEKKKTLAAFNGVTQKLEEQKSAGSDALKQIIEAHGYAEDDVNKKIEELTAAKVAFYTFLIDIYVKRDTVQLEALPKNMNTLLWAYLALEPQQVEGLEKSNEALAANNKLCMKYLSAVFKFDNELLVDDLAAFEKTLEAAYQKFLAQQASAAAAEPATEAIPELGPDINFFQCGIAFGLKAAQ